MAPLCFHDSDLPPSYETLQTSFGCLKNEVFEGMQLAYTHGINTKAGIPLRVLLSPTGALHADIGVQFLDPKWILMGKLTINGMLKPSHVSEAALWNLNAAFEYKGKDYRALFAKKGASLYSASFVRTLSSDFSFGGEICKDVDIQKFGYSCVGRYHTEKTVAIGKFISSGITAFSYSHSMSKEVALAAGFLYDYVAKGATVSLGYEYTGRKTRLRGAMDSDGCITSFWEERLAAGLILCLSAEIDHKKKDYKFGFGMKIAE